MVQQSEPDSCITVENLIFDQEGLVGLSFTTDSTTSLFLYLRYSKLWKRLIRCTMVS